mgnify:CR=1 FL=1
MAITFVFPCIPPPTIKTIPNSPIVWANDIINEVKKPFLDNGIIIETKGFFDTEDRYKHIEIKKQHPELDIRIVFMSGKTKIRKGSKTTYGSYCDKHGIKWAEKLIPNSWFSEKN